jgi:glycosyltransferase involved in cell wall biosynthesis
LEVVMPLVTVVIPLYNKQKYIRRAIDSVLAQTIRHFELVVVNDGSTDNGRALVCEYTDPRLRLVDQENRGESGARNRGITEARGQLIAFLDADDEWCPEFLATVLDLRERFPAAGAYATGLQDLKDGKLAYRNRCLRSAVAESGCCFDLWRRGAFIHSSCVAIPRRVFDAVGVFREGYVMGADIDMWFRIALRFPVACSPAIGARYHGYLLDNASHVAVPNEVSPLLLSFEDMEADAAIGPAVKAKARRFLKRRLANQIHTILLQGRRELAGQRLRQYYRIFGRNGLYVRLMVFKAMPLVVLRFLFGVRAHLATWLLILRGLTSRKKT